jgi:hypothetical protein
MRTMPLEKGPRILKVPRRSGPRIKVSATAPQLCFAPRCLSTPSLLVGVKTLLKVSKVLERR